MTASDDESGTKQMLTVMVVEDHQITRMGLRLALEQVGDINIVAESADGTAAVTTALQIKPMVILMDIGLPGINGIEAAQQIKAANASIGIIMLTSHNLDQDVMAAFAANCDGYCLKDVKIDQLVNAIRTVNSGGIWLDPTIGKRVIRSYIDKKEAAVTPTQSSLSERELEVLTLLVEGMSNQEIAKSLVLSTETVKTHMRHIMEKLAVSDRTQAAVKALRTGIV